MRIVPDIPVIYSDKFPEDYVNDVDGWSFTGKELEKNKGRLLTLDIDFGNNCMLNCGFCFRRGGMLDSAGAKSALSYSQIIAYLKEAKKLGLRSVKFLGAGEPLQEPTLLKFLEDLKRMDIIPLIFTKAHVIGDDALARKFHGHRGITSGEDLVKKLKSLNARILLNFLSFDTEIQDRMVGNIEGYTLKRNRALELLVKHGFNSPNPTHLCILPIPITRLTFPETFEIYRFARERNIYPVVTPTMVAGRSLDQLFRNSTGVPAGKIISLYTKIYGYNIEKGIQTLEEIEKDGVASYAGGAPCNQVACGMYVTLPGIVLRCPGDETTIFGDITKQSLKEIWQNSENFKRAGTFNCHCPPKDGKVIPEKLYTEVLSNLQKKYK